MAGDNKPDDNHKIIIGVIGAGTCTEKEEAVAEQVGREIARQGGILVCGGLGGVMQAASRGAKAEHGTTIGILPGSDKQNANRYIDFAIATGIGEARNLVIIKTADVVIALPGKFGTLSEMAFCKKMNKPIVSLSNWDIADDIEKFDDPIAAVKRAFELAGEL
jgi:uncharacterized protein (TIGR00725 family)